MNNNNKISNPKTEVPTTIEMNDLNYLTDILESVKNMVNNYSYALNEASNESLYNRLKAIFDAETECQRHLFELMFKKGWYCLEKAEEQKITQAYNKAQGQVSELA